MNTILFLTQLSGVQDKSLDSVGACIDVKMKIIVWFSFG